MNSAVRNKLSVMMFLEFFIWGAWFTIIFDYLKILKYLQLQGSGWEWLFSEQKDFVGFQVSCILNAFAVASFVGMFFSTQFADRNFAAEKFMAFSHFVGGVALVGLTFVTDFWPFFWLMLLHALFYVPTISISNSIAFANLKESKDFAMVRLWGTIGWIAASWPFFFLLADWTKVPNLAEAGFIDWLGAVLGNPLSGTDAQLGKRYAFMSAGIASLLLAAFSLVLPHTPPKPAKEGSEKFAWLEAMKLLRVPFLFVLFVVTFIDAAVHQGYFVLTETFLKNRAGIPANWAPAVMSIGQVAEIGTMAILGYCLKTLGWKTTLIIGVLGHTARFAVFALVPDPWLVVTANVLHGICYAFFFATVYILVDDFFPKDARSSAQGLFNFLILGLGPFVGNFVWPYLEIRLTRDGVIDYQTLFLVLSGTALFAAVLLLLFFHPPAKAEGAAAAAH